MDLTLSSTAGLNATLSPLAVGDRGALTGSQRQFANILGQLDRSERAEPRQAGRRTPASSITEEQAREVARQFVAVALVQPLLAELRASNSAKGVFAPSQGEKQFQTMFDGQIAQRIVSASNFGIVDKLTADMMRRRGLPAETNSAPQAAATLNLAG